MRQRPDRMPTGSLVFTAGSKRRASLHFDAADATQAYEEFLASSMATAQKS